MQLQARSPTLRTHHTDGQGNAVVRTYDTLVIDK